MFALFKCLAIVFSFSGSGAIVGDGGNVGNEVDFETAAAKDSKGGISTWAGAFDKNFYGAKAVGFGFGNDLFDGDGGGVGSRFFRSGETSLAGATPGDAVTWSIGNGD